MAAGDVGVLAHAAAGCQRADREASRTSGIGMAMRGRGRLQALALGVDVFLFDNIIKLWSVILG